MSVHGTARFATRQDAEEAGLLGGHTRSVEDNVRHISGMLIGFWHEGADKYEPLQYRGDLHQLVVAGTGGGKFTSAIAPMLLGSSLGTAVIVDPKGEAARLLGAYFEGAHQDAQIVHILDPWDVCETGSTSALNVLAEINLANPTYVDDARALADAMVIPSGGENTHWDNSARNFLTALLLYVALDPLEEGRRDLLRVRDIVTLPWAMPKKYKGPKKQTLQALLLAGLESDLAHGAVRRGFSSLFNREDKERSGILSSIERDTAWIDSPQMEKVLRGPTLDLKAAAQHWFKYFIVLPPDFFMTHRVWLRLMIIAFAKAFRRYPRIKSFDDETPWRHIIIDEFANLGEMSFVLNDIAIARGYGVKYTLAVQDLAQLRRTYQDGWESFINNSFQRVFSVGDLFTAQYVSDIAGMATVESESQSETESGGESRSSGQSDTRNESSALTADYKQTSTVSGGSTTTWSSSTTSGWSRARSTSPIQRRLITPDEVRRMTARNQLILFRGAHPIISWRPPYWEIFAPLPPPYTLKEIWKTVNAEPLWGEWEPMKTYHDQFVSNMRRSPKPAPVSKAVAALPAPPTAATPAPPPGSTMWNSETTRDVIQAAKWISGTALLIAVIVFLWPVITFFFGLLWSVLTFLWHLIF